MSRILSIGTAVPVYKHRQADILDFMQRVYALNETDKRKLKFLYHQSGIETRYSAIPDYSLPASLWQFFIPSENLEPFPSLEKRMQWYTKEAAALSLKAVHDCVKDYSGEKITHLITVSCTGMTAPGLDLELMELLNLPLNTFHTSVNFMGCYAAIQALTLADAFCKSDRNATVLIVSAELCTLHFQKEYTVDNITSSLLFGDGAAAVLVSGDDNRQGLHMDHFYSTVSVKGKQDMAWELSSKGFLMTLSSYIADLVKEDFDDLVNNSLASAGLKKEEITYWGIHPGGKKILEAVNNSLGFTNDQLKYSYQTLKDYGNMSSPTVLFVLKEIMKDLDKDGSDKIFGAAFGPGLTMQTFILSA